MQDHLRHRGHRAGEQTLDAGFVAPATEMVQPSQLMPANQ
jgi:hypothetical protein